MKNAILLIALCLPMTHANAQLRLGAEVGLNMFKTNYENTSEHLTKTGTFHPGPKLSVIASYRIVRHLSVQSGISYSVKGFKHIPYHPGMAIGESYNYWAVNLHYLEIPLNIYAHLGKNFQLGVGGYYSYAVDGDAKITSYENFGQTVHTTKIDVVLDNPQPYPYKGFKKGDYGLHFSAGYNISPQAAIQFQFSQGMRDIAPDVPFYVKIETYKNWGLTLSGMWYFAKPGSGNKEKKTSKTVGEI